jgi:hypothetical protein
MIRYGKDSKFSPQEVVQKAIAFFGPGGIGLETKLLGEGEVRFEGGGGHVLVQVHKKGKGAEIDLLAVEWEYDARRFLGKI